MDVIGDGIEQVFAEFPGRLSVRLLDQLSHGELAGSVNGHKEIEFALYRPQLGNVDIE